MEIVDNINHPKHYEDAGYLVQPIDVCQELPFCLGNAVKYLCRAGNKEGCPELEDLKKAQWYLNRQLALLDNGSTAAVLSARGACAARFIAEKHNGPLRWLFENGICGAAANGFVVLRTDVVSCLAAVSTAIYQLVEQKEDEEVREYDPHGWNDFPEVEPPEGVLMRVECRDGRKACAKYRLFIEGGSWCDVNGGAWPEAYSQSVARFRPWDEEDEE